MNAGPIHEALTDGRARMTRRPERVVRGGERGAAREARFRRFVASLRAAAPTATVEEEREARALCWGVRVHHPPQERYDALYVTLESAGYYMAVTPGSDVDAVYLWHEDSPMAALRRIAYERPSLFWPAALAVALAVALLCLGAYEWMLADVPPERRTTHAHGLLVRTSALLHSAL